VAVNHVEMLNLLDVFEVKNKNRGVVVNEQRFSW
jgi:hypothetical protein